MVDEIGDCEDSAILYASLVRTLEYGALLSVVDTDGNGKADHMITLVPVYEAYAACTSCRPGSSPSFWTYEGQLYALAETTGNRRDTTTWDVIHGGLGYQILSKYEMWLG